MNKQSGIGEFSLFAIIAALALAVLVALVYWRQSAECTKKSQMMGLRCDYSWLAGCMVKVGDRYAPISYIRIVDDKVIIQGDGEQ